MWWRGGGEGVTSAELIAAEYDRLKEMSLAKNAAYGDSALNPVRVFSQLPAAAAIRARLDDKLSRHRNAPGAHGGERDRRPDRLPGAPQHRGAGGSAVTRADRATGLDANWPHLAGWGGGLRP